MKFVHRLAATAGLLALAVACTPAAEEAAAPAAAVESLVSEPAATAEQDLNAAINIALNPTTGLPIFFGGSQGGMACLNPPISGKRRSAAPDPPPQSFGRSRTTR